MSTYEHQRGLFAPAETPLERLSRERRTEGVRRVRRRLALRWGTWGLLGGLVSQVGLSLSLGFLWPRKTSAFGSVIRVRDAASMQIGAVQSVRAGKFYVARVPEGFLALWWKCPHLGCTVPWKESEPLASKEGPAPIVDDGFATQGRFECPCHSSTYNRYGQIVYGPAPRPMDRFPVQVEGPDLLVNTGRPITRPVARASDATPL